MFCTQSRYNEFLVKGVFLKVVILDTETTGANSEDRICQLSYIVLDRDLEIESFYDDLCKPPLSIKFHAMAIHHITPQMVELKPPIEQTKAFEKLQELNKEENVLVIQNASFDLDMLQKEGFENKMQLVDTFRVLRKHYGDEGSNSLQFKRYQWGLYKKEQEIEKKLGKQVQAHDALGDVVVLKLLLDKLIHSHTLESMIKLCQKPILLEKVPFGKYKGESFEDISLKDREALNYMLKKQNIDQDIAYSINHFLEKTQNSDELVIGFGKYKEKTIEQVCKIDKGYLKWLYEQDISADLKVRILKVL